MTTGELIAILSKYAPETRVVSFHEDAPTPTHQIQQVHKAEYVDMAGLKWVVIQARQIDYETMAARDV